MADSENLVVDCGETLDISRVSEFYAELKMVLDENQPVDLDCSKIERVDTAGLQLLTVFSQKLKSNSLDLSWIEPSDVLKRSAQLLGLTEELGL